tara:strand:+ start:952 stop:1821 length:870 start_codon:yes stop_codon:yes gene_type:complete
MKNKKYLISFGSPDLKRSILRLNKQAKELNFYEGIYIYSINDFKKLYKDKILNTMKMKKEKYGYGYSYWKPLLIKQTLELINDNDVIHYVDLGCHLNKNGLERLKFYISRLSKLEKGILGFQYNPLNGYVKNDFSFPQIDEYKYTKADLLDYFNVLGNKEITHSKQYWAGNIFLKKNDFTLKFIDQWIDVFEKRFDLVDHTPSKILNFSNFELNKSDQSVYSLLCKLNKIDSLSAYECEWFYYNGKRYWEHTKNNPVIAKRDLQYNLLRRFLNRQKRTFNRYYTKLLKK